MDKRRNRSIHNTTARRYLLRKSPVWTSKTTEGDAMPDTMQSSTPSQQPAEQQAACVAVDHTRLRHHGSTRYWDRSASRYARQPITDEAAYQKKLAITLRYLRADHRVLEFGCGTGSTALLLGPHVHHILATDASAKMIAIAKEKAQSASVGSGVGAGAGNVSFQQAAIEGIHAEPDTFDAVLANSVLHLLRDRRAAMAQACKFLKPGGVFVTSTACLADFLPLFRIAAPLGRLVGLFPYVSVFTGDTLRAELRATGFEIIEDWQPSPNAALFLMMRKPA